MKLPLASIVCLRFVCTTFLDMTYDNAVARSLENEWILIRNFPSYAKEINYKEKYKQWKSFLKNIKNATLLSSTNTYVRLNTEYGRTHNYIPHYIHTSWKETYDALVIVGRDEEMNDNIGGNVAIGIGALAIFALNGNAIAIGKYNYGNPVMFGGVNVFVNNDIHRDENRHANFYANTLYGMNGINDFDGDYFDHCA